MFMQRCLCLVYMFSIGLLCLDHQAMESNECRQFGRFDHSEATESNALPNSRYMDAPLELAAGCLSFTGNRTSPSVFCVLGTSPGA